MKKKGEKIGEDGILQFTKWPLDPALRLTKIFPRGCRESFFKWFPDAKSRGNALHFFPSIPLPLLHPFPSDLSFQKKQEKKRRSTQKKEEQKKGRNKKKGLFPALCLRQSSRGGECWRRGLQTQKKWPPEESAQSKIRKRAPPEHSTNPRFSAVVANSMTVLLRCE